MTLNERKLYYCSAMEVYDESLTRYHRINVTHWQWVWVKMQEKKCQKYIVRLMSWWWWRWQWQRWQWQRHTCCRRWNVRQAKSFNWFIAISFAMCLNRSLNGNKLHLKKEANPLEQQQKQCNRGWLAVKRQRSTPKRKEDFHILLWFLE